MKRNILLLVVCTLSVWSLSAQDAPFRGGALAKEELQGPVKSVKFDSGYEIKFDRSGKYLNEKKPEIIYKNGNTIHMYTFEEEELNVDFVYDSKGKLIKCSRWETNSFFKYYSNGLLKMVSGAENLESWNETYIYDSGGRLVKIIEATGSEDCRPEDVVTKEKICCVTKIDQYGNWLERTLDGEKEARTITYYDSPGISIVYSIEYIDLGLSVKWASCNLGASKPEEYGGYYQWACTEKTSDKRLFWDTCPYHSGLKQFTGWTKYCPACMDYYWSGSSTGPDNKTVLDPEDDVAQTKLGGRWRMPTDREWRELMVNCQGIWTDNYNDTGVPGYIMSSKKPGYTDKSIFLPAAGYRSIQLDYVGSYGSFWSSSLNGKYPEEAFSVSFNQYGIRGNFQSRFYGKSVRPVME